MATSAPAHASVPGETPTGGSATLSYVYAILPADPPAVAALRSGTIRGIHGGVVRAVEQGNLAAAVGDVPAEEFEEAPLNRLLGNMEWLGEHAGVHQAVNAQLFVLTDALLPLSFG